MWMAIVLAIKFLERNNFNKQLIKLGSMSKITLTNKITIHPNIIIIEFTKIGIAYAFCPYLTS